MNSHLEKAASYWSNSRPPGRTRWWNHPIIHQHINRIVCGHEINGPWAGLHAIMAEIMPSSGFLHAIFIGCGEGAKEVNLLNSGVVQHFDLYEISKARIEKCLSHAAQLGVANRITIHQANAFSAVVLEKYDLVYWNNSLHHMLDVSKAIEWSRACLKIDGLFVMDDFVGPSRFQWSDYELNIAERVRGLLPSRFFLPPPPLSASDALNALSARIDRPSVQSMIDSDPTEAADSSNIIPSLSKVFPNSNVIYTGGVIYHLALNDVLAHFDDIEDLPLLKSLLLLDETLAAAGCSHYAVAFATKN